MECSAEGHEQQNKKLKLLLSIQADLTAKVDHYHLHLKQYESCRQHLKQIEHELKPGQCLCYRDFVNQHNAEGGKVVNLVLCLLWREQEQGPLFVLNIYNFCTDKQSQSADAYHVADVMDFQLQKKSATNPGTFDAFSEIFFAGDHGPHLSSVQTMYNESCFYEKYNKEVESHFLCSYHAFNRCDGAGVQPKHLTFEFSMKKMPLVDAHDYATAVNTSEYVESVAYPFKNINRCISTFPSGLCIAGKRHYPLKSYCIVKYHYFDQDGKKHWEKGCIRAALFWETQPCYHFLQLAPKSDTHGKVDSFCGACSSDKGYPVRCQPDNRQTESAILAQLSSRSFVQPDRSSVLQPDPLRVTGSQITRTAKSNSKKRVGKKSVVEKK